MVKFKSSKDYIQQASKIMGFDTQEPGLAQKISERSMVIRSANGAEIVDQENNVYTDYCMADGALILGHAHRNVVLAAKKTAERGISFCSFTRHEVELAEHIVRRIPSLEVVRLCQTSAQAIKNAISLSREFTQRKIVVSFSGCSYDNVHTDEGDDINVKLPYNDIEALDKIVSKINGEIACFLVEPVATTMGIVYAESKFLQALKDLSKKHGIVLIFDEINTAFRGLKASYQQECGINADITCLGKIIGAGFPLGAYGGRREIIQCLDSKEDQFNDDAFYQCPVIAKAGLAALRLLNENLYKGLERRANNFFTRLNEIFKINDINAYASCYKSIMSIYFRKEPIYNLNGYMEASSETEYDKLYEYLKSNGIRFPRSYNKPFCISALHRKKDLNKLLSFIEEYFLKQ
ncbi:MAG: aminotransferase class III-fold pyridoxal phosphate-dependent enzyme [Candidatus Omnitrophica bacterium]|nr:aminotransferase class III-fold pyridoxal phosphate-dependent enzyme [Candidatus Omnitrophota bacterium]